MPKYGIHHIVLCDSIGQLLASPSAASRNAGADLATNRDMAALGSIGPDLFFWAPDYVYVDRLYRLYRNIDQIVDLYDRVVQPIRDVRDAVVEPVEDAVETLAPSTVALIRHALNELQETARLFRATLATGLFAGVMTGFNALTDLASLPSLSASFFELLKPPLQSNRQEDQWYWFDMTHYRNTGDFARRLVTNASAPRQRAYAYGYLSHIASDFVGHPFVNQIAGGPFRMQVQRHVLVENFMDTWKFQRYYGESVNLKLFDKLGLPATLPVDVGDLLHESFREAYSGVPHPPFLGRDQIDETYDIFFNVLRIMQKMAISRPEEPFSGVADVLSDALEDLLEAPPSPPSSTSSTCSWGDILSFGLTSSSQECYEEFFEQLEEWFDYLGELLAWTLETLLDLVDLLLAALLSLPVIVLLAILYGLQLLLYEAYQAVRFALVLEGFVLPEPDDLNTSHGRNLTTTFQCCVRPGVATIGATHGFSPPVGYPNRRTLSVSHLVCQPPRVELPTTVAGFHPCGSNITSDEFISQVPFNLANLEAYARCSSPVETRALERNGLRIGNATDLTTWMISTAVDPASEGERDLAFMNWNLDSDRGYGYKSWVGTVPTAGEEAVVGEDFTAD